MGVARYESRPSRSAWVAQLAPDGPARPVDGDVDADVVVVGAGIAGVATAFFVLRETDCDVLLLERDRVGRGATGHNAGQLTTYFERPLHALATQFGPGPALRAQRDVEGAHELLDLMAAECGTTVRVERFTGHMGMFALDHVLVHLRNNLLRRGAGMTTEACVVAEDAPYLQVIPNDFDGLWTVVPRTRIHELLGTDDPRYSAVLSDRKGCANSALLVQQVLDDLESRYPTRLHYADHTYVERIVVEDTGVVLHAGGHRVNATRVILCTNGFTDFRVEDSRGAAVTLAADQEVAGLVGYMAAFVEEEQRPPAANSFVRNLTIGADETPYVYVTRRTYDRPDDVVTLTCMGGPERALGDGESYDRGAPFPAAVIAEMDEVIRPFAQPDRPAGVPFDFTWHGLMGYNDALVRVVGPHPRHPQLMYNLGCNGIGFLPSIMGGRRIARLLAGERLEPSIFDPR